ncbi:PAS domain-containing protein, partial [Streptomyces chattanoogensis]|uniref:PAS domain-containing protein n=1 Tax=Streptomyces chattanoogensis TaxID=66876 RepID=UPI0036AABA16
MIFTRWSAKLPGTQRRTAARADRAAPPAGPAAPPSSATPEPGEAPTTSGTGSVPAARAETASAEPSAPVATPPTVDALSVHDILGTIPALVAVVYGPEHRIAYVNGAYAGVFGPRPAGHTAREALPELAELGLLPLMDQVLRSGKPRTVKSRKVPGGAGPDRTRDGYYTFTCTPIEVAASGPAPDPEVACIAPHKGVLVFGADVTDQVESAERLRVSEARQRAAAVTLQRSLLPQELEQPDDLRVAATY